jgi:hypothetical protein
MCSYLKMKNLLMHLNFTLVLNKISLLPFKINRFLTAFEMTMLLEFYG